MAKILCGTLIATDRSLGWCDLRIRSTLRQLMDVGIDYLCLPPDLKDVLATSVAWPRYRSRPAVERILHPKASIPHLPVLVARR